VIDGSQEDAEDRPVRVSARKKALLDRRILEERKTAFETHKELVFVLRCKAAGDREGGGYGDDGCCPKKCFHRRPSHPAS